MSRLRPPAVAGADQRVPLLQAQPSAKRWKRKEFPRQEVLKLWGEKRQEGRAPGGGHGCGRVEPKDVVLMRRLPLLPLVLTALAFAAAALAPAAAWAQGGLAAATAGPGLRRLRPQPGTANPEAIHQRHRPGGPGAGGGHRQADERGLAAGGRLAGRLAGPGAALPEAGGGEGRVDSIATVSVAE
jgi:hypothetical protein